MKKVLSGAVVAALALACAPAVTHASSGSATTAGPGEIPGRGFLPDGRGWEKVTPEDKGGGDVFSRQGTFVAANDGDRAAYMTYTAFGGSEQAFQASDHMSARTADGWQDVAIAPPVRSSIGVQTYSEAGYQRYSADLTAGLVNQTGTALVDGADDSVWNLYRRDIAGGGAYSLLTPAPLAPLAAGPMGALLAATTYPAVASATDDLRTVAFERAAKLTPDAPTGRVNAYVSSGGVTKYVGILPDGTPAPGGARIGGGTSTEQSANDINQPRYGLRALSADGRRVYFTTPPARASDRLVHGDVYLREGDVTRKINVSQRSEPDPEGPLPAVFWTASRDGSRAFFTSCEKLTDNSTAFTTSGDCLAGSTYLKNALYRYDVTSGAVTDLTAASDFSVDEVIAASDDGSRLYVLGQRILGSGTPEDPYHGGDAQIAVIDAAGHRRTVAMAYDVALTRGGGAYAQVTASKDGRWLAFAPQTPLAGFTTGGLRQIFLYDAVEDRLSCVSCAANAADVIGPSIIASEQSAQYRRFFVQRRFDASGRFLYFETPNALVAQDTNRKLDVYQYDTVTGGYALISTGTGMSDAHMLDVSDDGRSVFFSTHQQVIPQLDRDSNADVYVARVGGGFAVPDDMASACEGDRCQGELRATDRVGAAASAAERSAPPRPAGSVVLSAARLTAAQRRSLARGMHVRLVVKGTRAANVRVEGRARLSGKRRTVLRGHATVGRGGSAAVGLVLTKAARRELARRGRLVISVVVRLSAGSQARSSTSSVVLTVPRSSARAGR